MIGLSETELKLRRFVDQLTAGLTENTDVRIVPADAWAATPTSDPPTLMYRVADVAVIGDRILAVTGHEIGHLLYTTEYKYKFDVSKKPKAAHQLLNVVEDARIERKFGVKYPGAESLFVDLHGDGPDESDRPFSDTMRSKFDQLPIKWRYIFNIDRLLHGNDLLGSDADKQAVMDVADSLKLAADAPTTQECADLLEPAYKKLLEMFIAGAQELKKRKQEREAMKQALDQATAEAIKRLTRPDMVQSGVFGDDEDDEQDEDVAEMLREHEAAEADDGKPGGKDGSPGMRKDGEGEGEEGAPGNEGDPNQPGKGDIDLDAQADPTGSGVGTNPGKGTMDVGGIAGEGDPDVDAYGEREELSDADRVKAINIFEEMLAEESTSGNTAIRQLQRHQAERAKRAQQVEKQMKEEAQEAADNLSDVFGNEPGTMLSQALRDQLAEGGNAYERDRQKLLPEIRQLRAYAHSVLADNARRRWGGGRDSGTHIRKTRLFKPALDEFDVFQRRTEIGGKSYSIAVVVDQSGSMASYSNQASSKQALAYHASLVFLEAFDGLARTCLIGFTDFPKQVNARRVSRYRYRAPSGMMPSRTYKTVDQTLAQRKFTVPMLRESLGSTPMGAGIRAGLANLRKEQTEVQAIVLITDGYPSDGREAEQAATDAKRAGIPIYSILVSDYLGKEARAEEFLSGISERVIPITSPGEIPPSVYRLLRGIVRRGGAVARF